MVRCCNTEFMDICISCIGSHGIDSMHQIFIPSVKNSATVNFIYNVKCSLIFILFGYCNFTTKETPERLDSVTIF